MSTFGARTIYRLFGTYRLMLAMLVVAQHFVAGFAPADIAVVAAPYEVGTIAVLAFFTLSGFVIMEAAATIYATRPAAFLANRLLRIVPHFVLAAALSICVFAWFDHAGTLRFMRESAVLTPVDFGAENIIANLFGFLPLVDRAFNTNFLIIGWTLRVEMAFYIVVFASLMFRGRRLGQTILVGAMLALFAGALAGRAPLMFLFVPYFLLGAGLYFAADRRDRGAYWFCALMLVCIAIQLGAQPTYHQDLGYRKAFVAEAVLLTGLLALLAVLAFRGGGPVNRVDRRLGDLTYPLYLYHQVVMVAVLSLTSGYSWASLAVALVVSLALSAILEMAVAAMIDRWRDRVRGRRPRTEVLDTLHRSHAYFSDETAPIVVKSL